MTLSSSRMQSPELKFPLSRIILVVLFLMSVLFTLKVSQTPVKNDKRKIITNATLFHSEEKKVATKA